jgi:hypothetical protein
LGFDDTIVRWVWGGLPRVFQLQKCLFCERTGQVVASDDNQCCHGGLSEGSYAAIAQSGNMAAIATPVNGELADLNRKLGTTLVGCGGGRASRVVASKQLAAEAAPAAVTADRLSFNARSGVAVQGEGELLDGLSSGKVKLESLQKDNLPAELQKLDSAELKAEIGKKQKERAAVQEQIQKLSKQREEYIAAERNRQAEQGKGDSFDEKVAASIRAQAARKGIEYGKQRPANPDRQTQWGS